MSVDEVWERKQNEAELTLIKIRNDEMERIPFDWFSSYRSKRHQDPDNV